MWLFWGGGGRIENKFWCDVIGKYMYINTDMAYDSWIE